MQRIEIYASPLGEITLAADERGLTGLWLPGQNTLRTELADCGKESPVIAEAIRWLELYFAGRRPDFIPPLHLVGTVFQQEVWELLLEIPYGKTVTYGDLARRLAARRGIPKMSAQAVGGAVGRNPVSVIVPCHRVIGADGSLVGYAGGLDKKAMLLCLEGVLP